MRLYIRWEMIPQLRMGTIIYEIKFRDRGRTGSQDGSHEGETNLSQLPSLPKYLAYVFLMIDSPPNK